MLVHVLLRLGVVPVATQDGCRVDGALRMSFVPSARGCAYAVRASEPDLYKRTRYGNDACFVRWARRAPRIRSFSV